MELLNIKRPKKEPEWTESLIRNKIYGGLSYTAVKNIKSSLNVEWSAVYHLLHITKRTMERRQNEGKLQVDESDRVFRVARVVALSRKAFDSDDKASAWFTRPSSTLHGDCPVNHLDTDVGIRQVEEILFRICYGLYR
jgi:putative toxin-antitoxin system antitoxin component (TIGR02293 family)